MLTGRNALLSLLFALVSLTGKPAMALGTPEEKALRPYWCRHVQGGGGTKEEYNQMIARYGGGWAAMHHYCYALVAIMRIHRVNRSPGVSIGSIRKYALSNLQYVLDASPPDFVFRPEIMAHKIRLQSSHVGPAEALKTARALVSEWPQYADGYVLLADLLLQQKERSEAMQVLEKGSEMSSDKDRFERMRRTLKLD